MSCKKICIVGSYACGKTSIVNQLQGLPFDEKYLTTLGVKIHKIQEADMLVSLWDLPGIDFLSRINLLYVKDAAGIVIVVDGLREGSLSTAIDLYANIKQEYPDMSILTVVNKSDVIDQWSIKQTELERSKAQGLDMFHVSAKTGENVLPAIERLMGRIERNVK